MTRSLRKATTLQLEPVVAREATAVSRVSNAKTYLSSPLLKASALTLFQLPYEAANRFFVAAIFCQGTHGISISCHKRWPLKL